MSGVVDHQLTQSICELLIACDFEQIAIGDIRYGHLSAGLKGLRVMPLPVPVVPTSSTGLRPSDPRLLPFLFLVLVSLVCVFFSFWFGVVGGSTSTSATNQRALQRC